MPHDKETYGTTPAAVVRMRSAATASAPPRSRFYIEPDKLGADRAVLSGAAWHHMKNVLRMEPGAELIVFDGAEREVVGVLEAYQGETAVVRVIADLVTSTESSLDLTLAPCLAKGKKIDLVVEKAVELGVNRICVVTSKRSIARLSADSAINRVERWRRIAQGAAEQSGRTVLPVVERIRTIEEFATEKSKDTLGLVFTERSDPDPPATLRQRYPDTRSVICIIGPEGGLSPDEVAATRENGFIDVGLGPRTLRAETASIVAAAICQHLWGDLGRRPPAPPAKS